MIFVLDNKDVDYVGVDDDIDVSVVVDSVDDSGASHRKKYISVLPVAFGGVGGVEIFVATVVVFAAASLPLLLSLSFSSLAYSCWQWSRSDNGVIRSKGR